MALETLFAPVPDSQPPVPVSSVRGVRLPGSPLDGPLRPSVAATPSLPRLNALRAELNRLHCHIVRLRCEEPPKVTRSAALAYVDQRITRLAADSVDAGGTEDGWHDPEELLVSGDQIRALREELAEIAAKDAPYPLCLPDGCRLLPAPDFDLLGSGRLGNGKLSENGKLSAGSFSREKFDSGENGVSHLPMQRFATVFLPGADRPAVDAGPVDNDDDGWETL